MRKLQLLIVAVLLSGITTAQPNIELWWFNTTNDTYNGVLTDVEAAHYTNNYVFIESSGIPSYFVNYAGHSVFQPTDQNYVIRIQREPQEETGTRTSVFTGTIGVGLDGSGFFHWGDGKSWDGSSFLVSGDDIWHSLAWEYEGLDMDGSYGHSTATNVYHHHVGNVELFDPSDSSVHSPLIGYAFDGFPIYGPYGYVSAYDSSSGITRMTSSYQERSITARTSLPDGTVLTNPSDWGPNINSSYPLGSCEEDYEYVAGSGTLDTLNGRWCVTPEYPCGIYAYFVTLDASLDPDFPYIIGPEYKGVMDFSVGNSYTSATVPGPAIAYTVGTNICSTTITPTSSDPTCAGNDGSISVSVSGFGVEDICYNWSNGAGTNSITGLAAGSYTVEVSGDGCSDTLQVTLTGGSAATSTISATDPTTCASSDGSIQFGPPTGTGPFQFSVDSGATYSGTPMFSGLPAGTYVTVLQDGSGCLTYQTVTLNGGAAITISNVSTIDPTCGASDGSITVTASGGSSYTYSADGGSTFQGGNAFTNLGAGTYTVIALDTSGCADTTTVTLTNTASATATINTTDPTGCGNTDGTIQFGSPTGTGPFQFSIDSGATFGTTPIFSGLSAGTYVTVLQDSSGCLTYQTVTLAGGTAVSITNVSGTDPSCNGSADGGISITATGGNSYSYSIDGGSNFQSSNAFSGLSASTYTVIVMDSSGCADTTTITLADPSAISINGNVTDETMPMNGAVDITVAGGTPPYSYSWNPGGSTSEDLNGVAGNTSYTVTVTDANGCAETESFFIDSWVGISEHTDQSTISVYPNPTNNYLDLSGTGIKGVRLFDLTGKLVQAEGPTNQLHLAHLETGTYILQVELTDGSTESHRIVKY